MLLAAVDAKRSSTVAGRGFPDFSLDGALALMRISWRFKIRRVEGRWSMYDAISDHLPMLLALEDTYMFFNRHLMGVSGYLIGRCSSNDAYLFAI